MPAFYKSSAQNTHRAEDFCSIIIETRPTEAPPPILSSTWVVFV